MTSASEPLQVVSYNIRFGTANDGEDRWELRRPRTLEIIRRLNAEILSLQEALDFQIDEILAAQPRYASEGVGRDDGKQQGEFAPILFDKTRLDRLAGGTFWLSDQPAVVASKTWGNNITRICTWLHLQDRRTKRSFYVYNVHLDHQSQPSREKSVALVLATIADSLPRDPVLVTGDFNAKEDNPAILAMKNGGFRDSYRVISPTTPEPPTFNAFHTEPPPGKIDYVFVDSAWEVRGATIVMDRIDGRWPSDHMPVTAEVALR